MEREIMLNGNHMRSGDYYQFDLDRTDLERLAYLIKTSIEHRLPLRVSIGKGKIEFVPSSEGRLKASVASDGTLVLSANTVDLDRLAERFSEMAHENNPDLHGLVHTHLEPVYISSSPEVEDVVFERIEEDSVV